MDTMTQTIFAMTQRIKVLIALSILSFFCNCYYNPVVNSFLSPEETKGGSSLVPLALLGGGTPPDFTATALISGQLKDGNGDPIAGASLNVNGFSGSSRAVVSISATSDSGGKFSLYLRNGNTYIKVNDSNGNSLGGFTLTVENNTTGTYQPDASAAFTVTILSVTSAGTTAEAGGGSSSGGGDTTPPTLLSSSPVDGSSFLPTDPFFLTFSEDVASTNINSAFSFTPTVSYSANISGSVVTILATLAYKQSYKFNILPNGITDLAGNAFAPTTINFSTPMPP